MFCLWSGLFPGWPDRLFCPNVPIFTGSGGGDDPHVAVAAVAAVADVDVVVVAEESRLLKNPLGAPTFCLQLGSWSEDEEEDMSKATGCTPTAVCEGAWPSWCGRGGISLGLLYWGRPTAEVISRSLDLQRKKFREVNYGCGEALGSDNNCGQMTLSSFLLPFFFHPDPIRSDDSSWFSWAQLAMQVVVVDHAVVALLEGKEGEKIGAEVAINEGKNLTRFELHLYMKFSSFSFLFSTFYIELWRNVMRHGKTTRASRHSSNGKWLSRWPTCLAARFLAWLKEKETWQEFVEIGNDFGQKPKRRRRWRKAAELCPEFFTLFSFLFALFYRLYHRAMASLFSSI